MYDDYLAVRFEVFDELVKLDKNGRVGVERLLAMCCLTGKDLEERDSAQFMADARAIAAKRGFTLIEAALRLTDEANEGLASSSDRVILVSIFSDMEKRLAKGKPIDKEKILGLRARDRTRRYRRCFVEKAFALLKNHFNGDVGLALEKLCCGADIPRPRFGRG